MNEERLKQILKIDAQAQALYDQALSETDAIPAQAEEQVRLLIESTRKQAQEDAAKLVDEICDPQSIENILEKNKQKMKQREALAKANTDKAVDFVLQSILTVNN